jgi:hypothetical protein
MNIKENLKISKLTLTLIALDEIIKEYASAMGVNLNALKDEFERFWDYKALWAAEIFVKR